MYTFGVDVGGTTIKVGVFDEDKFVDSFAFDSTKLKKNEIVVATVSSIKAYLTTHKISENEIKGIGYGIPGNVINDYVELCVNINIEKLNLREETKKYFPNIEVHAANDANVAALGEFSHWPYQSLIMVTLGTGVGGGVVLNGRIVEGTHGSCGEIGHMIVDTKYKFKCNCGRLGCLETVASATGIVNVCNENYDKFETTLVKPYTCKDIFDHAKENDKLALYVLDEISNYLALALSNLAVVYDPDIFVIGGGVSNAGDILIDAIRDKYMKCAFFTTMDTKIELAKEKNNAGMIGASMLVR